MTSIIDLDNPSTFLDRNYDRRSCMLFYCGRMPVSPRQAFNLFKTKLHNDA